MIMNTTRDLSRGIWRLNGQILDIQDELMENGGEMTEAIMNVIEHCELSQAEIVDGLMQVSKAADADKEAIDKEIKRLQDLKKSRVNAVDGIKRYLLNFMVSQGISEIQGQLSTAKVAKGRESLEMDEDVVMSPYASQLLHIQDQLPPFIKATFKVSKTELKKAIDEGEPVIGARVVCNPSLRLK